MSSGEEITFQPSLAQVFAQATDFSPSALPSALKTISICEEHDSQLTLLHVVPETDDKAPQAPNLVTGMSYDARRLHKLVPQPNHLGLQPKCIVARGEPADVIVRTAQSGLADLIVLGARTSEKHL